MIGTGAPRRALWWWLILAVVVAIANPSAGHAHASLIASEPASDAVLASAPATITLSFNEAVEPLSLQLIDAKGVATPVARIARDGASLVLTPPPISGEGARVLSWRVMSGDGHPVAGSLTFWIGSPATALPSIVVPDDPSRRSAIWLARLAIYLGLFVGAGGAFFMAWMQPSFAGRGPRPACAAVSVAGLVALAMSIGLQGLDALDLPISELASSAVWRAGARGSFGWSTAIAAAALGLGLMSLRFDRWLARALSFAAWIGVGAALAASGHAASADPRYLTTAVVLLHGCSLAFWIGALLPLGWSMREPTLDGLTRFSRAIPFAIAALLGSGVALAMIQLTRVAELWTTAYGWVLCAKIALLLPLFAIALWNRLVVTPRVVAGSQQGRLTMRRSIAAEVALVIAILGVVGLWRFTPPPRALAVAAEDNFFVHLHTERAMASVTITPGQAGPVEIIIELETPNEAPLSAQALTVTLSNPTIGVEPASAEAQSLGGSRWRVRMSAPVPGRWMLGLGILISDFDRLHVEAPILIK